MEYRYGTDLIKIEPAVSYPDYGGGLRDLAKQKANDDACRLEFRISGDKKDTAEIDFQFYDEIFIGSLV